MITKLVAAIMGVFSVVSLGWGGHVYLHSNFAEKDSMLLAGAKVDYVLMKTEASVVREIAILERELKRRRLTQAEQYQLNILREELKEMREIRKGK